MSTKIWDWLDKIALIWGFCAASFELTKLENIIALFGWILSQNYLFLRKSTSGMFQAKNELPYNEL